MPSALVTKLIDCLGRSHWRNRVASDPRICRAPRNYRRYPHDQGRQQVRRSWEMPVTPRADETRERRGKNDRSDHKRNPPKAAQGALQLPLLSLLYPPRHQRLHRGIRQSAQSADRNTCPKPQPGGCEAVNYESREVEPHPAEHHPPIAELRDQRSYHPDSDHHRTHTDGGHREANRSRVPAIAIHRVQHEGGGQRLMRDAAEEIYRRQSEQLRM